MNEPSRSRWRTWGFGALVGLAAWSVVRSRRRARGSLSKPERGLERGKEAADVVAETTAALLRPPGTDAAPE